MKPGKRKAPQQPSPERSMGSQRDVDPDQPFPQEPFPSDPGEADDHKVDEAFEGKKHGEGNYEAARDYGKRVKSFVRSGQVERAADEAAPRDQAEAQSMEAAEREGRKRSKGEDPSASSGKKRREDVKR